VYKVLTYTLIGIEAHLIEVEADVAHGIPAFNIVGLPENTIKESKERIRSAIKNSKLPFPEHRITINLAPADIRKEGTNFDLPISIALVASTLNINPEILKKYLIAGELSLNGEIRKVKGALSAVFLSKKMNLEGLILPEESSSESAYFSEVPVYPVKHLLEAVSFLKGDINITPSKPKRLDFSSSINYDLDFSDVAGQFHAKRALEIASAGKHNVLMSGPPGSGKTMMAMRIPSIMPEMTLEESLETTMIYSASGLLSNDMPVITKRPFRSPHHTASEIAIVGGGTNPRPGEISLAHNGILFLDEFPEFKRSVIEALRQPLEEGVIHVSRASTSVTFPANFLLVSAMNPCFCGNLGDDTKPCTCTYAQILKYRKKLSGPILDRIDIHIEVPRVPINELSKQNINVETSQQIRNRVERAREIQKERFKSNTFYNSKMTSSMIKKYCKLNESSQKLLNSAIEKFKYSARTYNKILKLSRTIADLDGSIEINENHVAEAIQLRGLDKQNL
ncbi:MAG: YifB family Mg chelatase-like AAA ATPase, partial [Proteobacteria bacterium]|nr:YifB family Mg chelatase-like AAA ATPase [Pseudomonadota bacterium]